MTTAERSGHPLIFRISPGAILAVAAGLEFPLTAMTSVIQTFASLPYMGDAKSAVTQRIEMVTGRPEAISERHSSRRSIAAHCMQSGLSGGQY